MRFDALLHVRAGLQVRVLVMNDAVDVARLVNARFRPVARVPVADLAVFTGQARLPRLRAGNDAVDGVLDARQSAAAALDESGTAVACVGVVVVRGAVAGLAVMTAHSADRHENLRKVLRAVATRCGEIMQHPDIVRLADLAREIGDLLDGYTADLGSPLGSLLDAVIFSVEVIEEVHVLLEILGLMVGIETDRVLVEEIPVDDVALLLVQTKHLRGNAQEERGIGAGAHGNPVRVEDLRGGGVNRIDDDELHARFLGADVVITRRAGGRPRRI